MGLAAVAAVLLTSCSVSLSGPSGSTPPPTSTTSTTTPPRDAGNIEGIQVHEYDAVHALPTQRVRYTVFPPDGGRHAPSWANCMGAVYAVPVRNENMVHSLEHGAVWIAYNAERVSSGDLATLTRKVDGQPYMMLSPYPGLDAPISLQSWGHQLKLDDANDVRVDDFIRALRQNPDTTPEPGAPCDTGPDFDVASPPPFDTGPLPPDAAPVEGP